MSVVMHRSFAEFMGVRWPKDVVAIVNGRSVMRADILDAKRERQRERLERILRPGPQRRVARISVRYFNQSIYGGWHAYVDLVGREGIWVRPSHYLTCRLLRAFPLVLDGNFREWLPVFARTYRRGKFGGKPRGVVDCWAVVDGDHIDTFQEMVLRP